MNNKTKDFFIFSDNQKVSLFCSVKEGKDYTLKSTESDNGYFFKLTSKKPYIKKGAKKESVNNFTNYRINKISKKYFLIFKKTGLLPKIMGAVSTNLIKWDLLGPLTGIKNPGVIVPDFFYDKEKVMYTSTDTGIKIAFSKDLKKWETEDVVLKPRSSKFDYIIKNTGNAFVKEGGIVLFYYAINKNGRFAIGMAIFDKDNPSKLIWRTDRAIWTAKKNQDIKPINIVELNDQVIFYFQSKSGEISIITLPIKLSRKKRELKKKEKSVKPILKKVVENPIFGPIEKNNWEAFAAFNPTSFEHKGKIYLLYRAMGYDALSTIGCAITSDGINIEERYDKPVYVPREAFEGACITEDKSGLNKSMSGGGWGGCEDARVTVIDNKIYILYAAFNGMHEMDIAISSISLKDFDDKKWKKWSKPVLITCRDIKTKCPKAVKELIEDRPAVIHVGTGEKDASILPEKINGKYVIFHRIWPNIVFDYVDNLDFTGKHFLKGEHIIPARPYMWDSHKIALGATPIRIKEGWLLIYNSVDKNDFGKYKIGAMILDAKDPGNVLYRSSEPILEPETDYENNGNKPGIVFACGATVKNGELFIYYGGSDKYTCVATVNLKKFVKHIIESENPKIKKIDILKIIK